MRVLIFFNGDLNLGSGSEIRARLITLGLRFAGADVAVVASTVPDELQKIGIKSFVPEENGDIAKVLNTAAKNFNPDYIYGITESRMDIVATCAKRYKAKIAYDLHGIGAVEIIELGGGYGPRFPRVMRSLRWLSNIPRAHLITIANPTLFPILRVFNPRRTRPIFGMTDVQLFRPDGPSAPLNTEVGRLQVLYAGNYFKWQGVNLLLDAIEIICTQHPETFMFTIVGSVGKDIKLADNLQKRFKKMPVKFIESVNFHVIPDFYRAADILVIPRPFMLSTYLAMPQKITDYMASGRTIIATNLSSHRWALSHPKSGIICASNAKAIAQALLHARDANFRKVISTAARQKALASFDYRLQTQRILELLKKN
jgi:glycosyltransferase involved in cell wall biosynthesis